MNSNKQTQTTSAGEVEIEAPVIVTDLHRQDRATSKVAGSPMAWRKVSVLQHCFDTERMGLRDSKDARARLAAGVQYTDLWDCSQSAGRDSTAGFDVGRSMGSGTPLNERQRDAIQRLVRIEMRLGQNDRAIVRGVCAWGHAPVEALRLAGISTEQRVTARFCEAMDALVDAIDATARSKRK